MASAAGGGGGGGSGKIDLIVAVRFYVDKIVSDPTIGGMKALILDAETTRIVSMVYSQTQILEKEVYLVEQLGKRHEPMSHLKAAVFVQPTEANLTMLIAELASPKFAEYHIFFSNIVPQNMLTRLGRADEHEMVRQVQEYYADFMVINEDFFQLGITDSLMLSSSMSRTMESGKIMERNVDGILSVLLALKRKPSQIRHQASSDLTKRIAGDIVDKLDDEIFTFRQQDGPLLLILDRRDDPVTPLLTQWTYQAMVHELLGLNHNRVSLKGTPGIKKELEEVVLSCTQDTFFARQRYANFGDLGEAIKAMLVDYQKKSKLNENIQSIEDMQSFMDRYPAFRSQAINVSKHVAVMSELSRLMDANQLLAISQLEQGIACSNEHTNHKRELLEKISSPQIHASDKLRLALLFIIRYESYDEVAELKRLLKENGVKAKQLVQLDSILDYAGERVRATNLFSQGGLLANMQKHIATQIHGVENVYTQHQPLLSHILDSISKGKLKDANYPLISSASASSSRPSEVIVFIVGGATFEEATKVAEFNASNPSFKVLLGGSCVHNSSSFLKEIDKSFGRR